MPRIKLPQIDLKEKFKDLVLGVEKNMDAEDGLYEYVETEDARTREDEWKDFLKLKKFPFIVGVLYIVTIIHMLLGVILSLLALHNLNPQFLPGNPFYIILWLLGPPAIWVWSTAFTFWNFHNRKLATLYLVTVAVLLTVFQQLIRFFMTPVLKATLPSLKAEYQWNWYRLMHYYGLKNVYRDKNNDLCEARLPLLLETMFYEIYGDDQHILIEFRQ